jgi:hypothetical protein
MLRYYAVDELVSGSFLGRHEVVAVGVLGDLLEVLSLVVSPATKSPGEEESQGIKR